MTKKLVSVIVRVVLAVISVWLIFCGAFMAKVATLTIGVVLNILLGLFLGAVALFLPQINKLCQKGFFKFIKILVCIGLLLLLGVTSFLAIYGGNDNVTYGEDAVIVLGAGLRGTRITYPLAYRLESALEYAKSNENAVIVVSGGQGSGESISEAEAMRTYLVERGISEARIISEDKSTSTYENLVFSKKILDEVFEKDYSCAVVTNKFHVYRASAMAKKVGLDCTHMGAKIQSYSVPTNYLREFLAVIKFTLLGN